MFSRRLWRPIAALVVAGLALTACSAGARLRTQVAARTGQVTTLTATTRVEASGTVQPVQSASLFWEAAGQVGEIAVQVGDLVKKGDVLMALDPGSVSANVIQAESELLAAQAALDELLHPTALSIANARQAVVDAQAALEKAQDQLESTAQPDLGYYEDRVAQMQQALLTAQENLEKASIGDLARALQNAEDTLETKTNQYSDAKTAQEQCPGCTAVFVNATGRRMSLDAAKQEYDDALNAYRVAELNYQQAVSGNQNAVEDAQEDLDDAIADLAWAKAGPDPDDLAAKQAAVAVAEAKLAEARQTLDELENGADPDDVRRAELRVAAAQATLDSLSLTAPFDGEVLAVNYLPGDPVSQGTAAVVLSNRSALHVEVSVDEADIASLQVGDPAEVTFDPLPDLILDGVVARINPLGVAQQGLVKYDVRVDLTTTDPRVLLGMTANVSIITDVQENALAVPIEAVQLDDQGEYVMRVTGAGAVERVAVISGETQADPSAGSSQVLVVVEGALSQGDMVQIPVPQPQEQLRGPFGGG